MVNLTKMFNNLKLSSCMPAILMVLVVLALIIGLFRYHGQKVPLLDAMSNEAVPSKKPATGGNNAVQGNNSGESYASAKGLSTDTHGLAPACSGKASVDPGDLLPKDVNSDWAKLNPAGVGDLSEVNLLKAGHHIGVNTVGNTLRNANQQLRSDPPVPQVNVGPWNNTTIEADTMRRPLELGA